MDPSRGRDGSPCPVGFIGDLEDPWVAAIAGAIEAGRPVRRTACNGHLPDHPFDSILSPRTVIIHRHRLDVIDAKLVERWRAEGVATGVILCVSPYVRYEELERWSGLFEMVASEAIAGEVLPGRLARLLDGQGRRAPTGGVSCRIEVASTDGDLARALAEACARAGYAAAEVEDRAIDGGPPGPRLTIWDVPVLEPDWPARMERRARADGPLIALGGFADRAFVARAREAGASACLELPCDIDDLIDVVDRVVRRTPRASWAIPARVEPPHRLPPRRKPGRRRIPATRSPWSDEGGPPRIPLGGQ